MKFVAERQGFEPWEPSQAQRFSRPPHSTTLAPLREVFRSEQRVFRSLAAKFQVAVSIIANHFTGLARAVGIW